jgi:hypothetical protein
MKKFLVFLLCTLFVGCATVPVAVPPQTPAQITSETILLVSNVYLVVPVANQAAFVKDANLIAYELQLLTSGQLPVPADFQTYLLSLVPASDKFFFETLVLGISGFYATEYPKLAGNYPALIADLNAFATGIQQGLPVAIKLKAKQKS